MEQIGEEDVEIVEEIVQELVTREVVEERIEKREEPQVRMQYAYEGQGMQVAKGEVSCIDFQHDFGCPVSIPLAANSTKEKSSFDLSTLSSGYFRMN